MRKLSLILAIATAVISAPTMAQNVTYACQYIRSAGLDWENKQWKVTGFNSDRPFFLKASDSKLDIDSIAKAVGKTSNAFLCHEPTFMGYQACIDYLGVSLIFDFNSMNGGVTRILGATQPDNAADKDSLTVNPFTCTKM